MFRGKAERLPVDDFVPEDSLLVELANCQPTVAAVERFLRRHGPLRELGSDGSFTVLLAQFVAERGQFRHTWDRVLGLPSVDEPYRTLEREVALRSKPWRKVEVKGFIECCSTGLLHHAETLYDALVFKLFSLAQRKKLRRCGNPGCTQLKYFVADHPKSQYCSELCASWAQSQAKRTWREERGDQWRSKRATQSDRKARGKSSKRNGG
jgi:hypothetical protein